MPNIDINLSNSLFFFVYIAGGESRGAVTGVFNKQKPGKGNHELLLSRGGVVVSIKIERGKK